MSRSIVAIIAIGIVFTACASCNHVQESTSALAHSPDGFRCADYRRGDFITLESIYISEWERRFNRGEPVPALRKRFASLNVYCHKVIPHNFGGGGILEGLLDNNNDVQLATFDPIGYTHKEIHEGAYTHEITHVALEAVEGDPDGCPVRMQDCPLDDLDCFIHPLGCDHAKGPGPWTDEHHLLIEDVERMTKIRLGR